MKHPRTAALTGGIASGKSTVAAMFRQLGAQVIDADVVARQVVGPGCQAWQEIVEYFGKDILLENNQINREQLAALVFASPEKRRILEQFIHPRVIAEIERQEIQIRTVEPAQVIIVDVPLLIEAGMHTNYATVLVVYVSESTQMQRLMMRDGLSEEEARQRIAAQMPLSEKRMYATYVITNEDTLEQTRRQVVDMYDMLLHHSFP